MVIIPQTRPPALPRLSVIMGAAILWLLLPLASHSQTPTVKDCAIAATDQKDVDQSLTQECIAPPQDIPHHPLDWVPLEYVPEALRDSDCKECNGRYIDPLADEDRSIAPEESDIVASAATSEMRGNSVVLKGGVSVEQGYRQLSGDQATLNREEKSGTLSGDITLREPGVLIRGETAQIYSESGAATVQGSQFLLHEQGLRGSAGTLRRDEEGLFHIDDGNISFCAPDNNDWAIRADSIELDTQEGVGTARGARLDVRGVPLLYTPWITFPLDDRRRTGLLWPDIGTDSRGGLDVSIPVYLNLAPNYDALYAPRYISERGMSHEMELRYLNPHAGFWSFGGAFLADDDRYADEVPQARSNDRWLAIVNHNALFDQRWRSTIDYSKASDADYLKDLDTSSLDTKRRTNLLQMGAVDYLGDSLLVNMQVRQFQSLAEDIRDDYKTLPQITAQYRRNLTPFQFEPIALAQYSNFDHDRDNKVVGQRLYAEAGVAYPMAWQYGFLNSTVKYRALEYDLEEHRLYEDSTPSAGSALASIDGGLFFERPTSIGGRTMLQTLEPRIYYLYGEYEDQRGQPDFDSAELTFNYNQLFRETRFSGRDRLDDANQVSLGITSRFISDDDGSEIVSASIGQIFYLEDREVRLGIFDPPLETSGSEIAADLNYFPNERLSLRSSIVWDPYSGEVNSGNLSTSYRWDERKLLNLGYTYRRPTRNQQIQPVTEQAHISTYYPIARDWSVFASWTYSIEAKASVEDMVGVEYDTCCWKVRLLHLRYYDSVAGQNLDFTDPNLERESSTQIQFELKGMGGFGARVSGLMEDMIRGFDNSEY